MKVEKTEMINIHIPREELENVVMQYIYNKYADVNYPKWQLEEFWINWQSEKNDRGAHVTFMHSKDVEVKERPKCSGGCDNCSNSVCR